MCSRSFFVMSPRVSKANSITYITAMLLMLTHYMIDPAKGHCTATIEGCEKGDSTNGMATEIKEIRNQQDILITNLQAIDQRLKEQDTYNRQVQGIFEILNASNQQVKNQPERLTKSLQTADLYLRDQVQSIYEFLNTSIQQLNDQHHIVTIYFQAVNRSLHEQDTYIKQIESDHQLFNASHQEIIQLKKSLQQIKDVALTSHLAVDQRSQEQVQNISKFLSTSFQQMNSQQESVVTGLRAIERRSLEQSICLSRVQSISEFLNASFQQMQNQQVSAMTSLVAIDRHLNEHDIFGRNKTEIKLELTKINALGDWIVIMHRFNGSLNFSRNWIDYRNGFGDKQRGELWLGNEQVHRLTNKFAYKLRIEVQLKTSGDWYYAEYSSFSLESESSKYTLRLSGYSGNAGDSLTNNSLPLHGPVHSGMKFSTWDNDNDKKSDRNCAKYFSGGWWYNYCWNSCLTCLSMDYFKWYRHDGWQTSGILRAARMMIKLK